MRGAGDPLAADGGGEPEHENRRHEEHRRVVHGVVQREGEDDDGAGQQQRRLVASPPEQPEGAGKRKDEADDRELGHENALQQPRHAYGEQCAGAEGKQAFLELAAEHDATQFPDRRRARLDVGAGLTRTPQDEGVLQQSAGEHARRHRQRPQAKDEASVGQEREDRDARNEAHDGRVIAEARREERDGNEIPARAVRLAPDKQRQQHAGDDGGVQRVDLRDDRLRPEDAARGEAEGRRRCDDTSAAKPPRDEERQPNGQRAEQGREEVDSVRERADRKVRERVRQEHIQRIARIVRDAEHAPDELEHRRVDIGGKAWRERADVQQEGDRGNAARPPEVALHEPVCPAGDNFSPSAGVSIHPSRST